MEVAVLYSYNLGYCISEEGYGGRRWIAFVYAYVAYCIIGMICEHEELRLIHKIHYEYIVQTRPEVCVCMFIYVYMYVHMYMCICMCICIVCARMYLEPFLKIITK